MRVGILGGTFNPIHFGHICPTIEAAKKLKLDKVIFVPAYFPPHKLNKKIISAHHRTNMINLAIEEYPHFELSTMEIDRKGISYSVDTVTALMEKMKYDDFFFIMGIDAFVEIDTWKDASRLLKSANFAVLARQGIIFSDLLEAIAKNLSEKLKDLQFYYGEAEPESGLKCIKVRSFPYSIISIETTPVDVSSTKIRERIKCGSSIKNLVPEKVNIYIEKNKLYR